jgi:hypothetical protein
MTVSGVFAHGGYEVVIVNSSGCVVVVAPWFVVNVPVIVTVNVAA